MAMATRLKVEMLTEIPVGKKMFSGEAVLKTCGLNSFRVHCKICHNSVSVTLPTILSYPHHSRLTLKSEMMDTC